MLWIKLSALPLRVSVINRLITYILKLPILTLTAFLVEKTLYRVMTCVIRIKLPYNPRRDKVAPEIYLE